MGRFNFRYEFESTAAGLWRIPGRSFLVKKRFRFNQKGLFCAEMRAFLG